AIPILGDISRRHAILRRDRGSYVLEAIGPTLLDAREVSGPVVLGENHLIQFGKSVRLRFTKPHALSATARITLESRHRTAPSADAVLLMAESCVLGAKRHSHVNCPGWRHDVILFRQEDGLQVRSSGELSVDGQTVSGAARIIDGSRIEGQDFTMGIELV
ncbi:MAG: hypothetical protein KDA37_12095, partial [Planctomycetales bacterium]|nr:hypothetical protein [Planctomycetales bacterium]